MFVYEPMFKSIPPILATALCLFAQTAAVHAQSSHASRAPLSSGQLASNPSMQRINIGVGKSVIVELPRDAAEIFVGNPKVANAIVRTPRKLYVIAAANGQTTIFAMDSAGQTISTVEINIGRDVGELSRILRTALPDSEVIPRTVEDTIILTGSVASAGDAQKALDIAAGFLNSGNAEGATAAVNGKVINSLTVRGRDQVMLKVTISEVQRNVVKQLGVTVGSVSGAWGALKMQNAMSQVNNALQLGTPTSNISATINAFERYGVARILAEPTVTAISGESAKFMVGGEVPVPSGQTCTTGENGQQTCQPGGVTFKPYGISLNFSPVVLHEGRILLRIATEVTEVDSTQAVSVAGTKIQAFRTRKNETSVELPSGGSIVSAGLLQMNSRSAIEGLPGLINIPVLGSLFRSREYQREETELLIIVTPYIAKSTNAASLSRPDDGFADATDPQAWFLGRVNKLYSSPGNGSGGRVQGRYGFILD
jgi:pilus assembly protein CpaC